MLHFQMRFEYLAVFDFLKISSKLLQSKNGFFAALLERFSQF